MHTKQDVNLPLGHTEFEQRQSFHRPKGNQEDLVPPKTGSATGLHANHALGPSEGIETGMEQ